ncbi:MAG: 50S ribosomal protein L20 [Planctomycetes bacterium]|nr:50S ribosomal protein L20 [Planctomycetota bacterium]
MPRARNSVAKLRKKRRLLRKAKGFYGGRHNLLRTVKETLIRGEAFATKHRRKKKGDWRRLWILRISAACKARGVNYSQFMNGLRKANVALNRKMLSDIAVRDAEGFDQLVAAARTAL